MMSVMIVVTISSISSWRNHTQTNDPRAGKTVGVIRDGHEQHIDMQVRFSLEP